MCFQKIRIFWVFCCFGVKIQIPVQSTYLNFRAEIISWWSVGLFAVLNFGAKIQLKLYIFRAKIQIRQWSNLNLHSKMIFCHEFMNFRHKVANTKILILFSQFWRENSKFFIFFREHSCLKPSFDLDVPYLLATLIPSQLDIQPNLIPPYIPSPPTRVQESESSAEKEANLNKIGQHAMKLLQQYQSDFSSKMQNWMREFMEQIKLLCLWKVGLFLTLIFFGTFCLGDFVQGFLWSKNLIVRKRALLSSHIHFQVAAGHSCVIVMREA